MNNDSIELADVAEVLAQVMSQEKIMAVPPVIIPTEGTSGPRKRPRKQKRNKYYTKKDPWGSQSVSTGNTPPEMPSGFPTEGSDKPEGCDGKGGGPGKGQGLHKPDTPQQPTNKSFVAKKPEKLIKPSAPLAGVAPGDSHPTDESGVLSGKHMEVPDDLEILTYSEIERNV